MEAVHEEKKKKGILSGIKEKFEEAKKKKIINEKFLYVTTGSEQEVDASQVVVPSPEEACNAVIRRLLENKQIET